MYSSKYLQYVVNTISAPLRSITDPKSATFTSSSAICFAVAVSLSTPSISKNKMGSLDPPCFVARILVLASRVNRVKRAPSRFTPTRRLPAMREDMDDDEVFARFVD